MRAISPFIFFALLVAAASAQVEAPERAPRICNVTTARLEVNDNGELVPAAPTADQCAVVDVLLEKFEAMDRRDFSRVVSREGIPGEVYTSISRYGTFGGPWARPDGLPRSDRPGQQYVVSWLTDTLVVIVSEGSDFSGSTTTVVIADLETEQVCSFPNWPDDRDPRTLSIRDIQEVLASDLRATSTAPACHLKPLIVE